MNQDTDKDVVLSKMLSDILDSYRSSLMVIQAFRHLSDDIMENGFNGMSAHRKRLLSGALVAVENWEEAALSFGEVLGEREIPPPEVVEKEMVDYLIATAYHECIPDDLPRWFVRALNETVAIYDKGNEPTASDRTGL